MADRTFIDLSGLNDLKKSLDSIRDDVKRELSVTMRETAQAIKSDAQRFAPKDRGDLARAIDARGSGLTWRVGITDQSIPERGGHNTAHLNPWVYGVWYELGFVTREIAKHEFMGPAVQAHAAAHDAKVDAILDEALK